MIKNYIKIAWRNLWKQKMYSLIHIIGLSIGVAACLLIFLVVRYELTFDQHHIHYKRIARVSTLIQTPESDNLALATSPYPLSDVLVRDYEEVESVARLESSSPVLNYKNELIQEPYFYESDQQIFSVFSFSIITGDKIAALADPNSIVLTESSAKKYFGSPERAIGQTLQCDQQPKVVTAVIADLPANSDVKIEGLISKDFSQVTSWMEGDFPVYTYILFKEKINLHNFEKKLQLLAEQYIQPELNKGGAVDYHAHFCVEALLDVHFSKGKMMDTPKGDKQINYIFSLLACVILIIALLNYINIATAKASDRGKEIGVRKVSGARATQLIQQFFIESSLLIALAYIIAITLVLLSVPYVNQLLNIELTFDWQYHTLFLVVIFLITVFGASLYPAFVLAGFHPMNVLKGNKSIDQRGISLRKMIIVFQFVFTIILIIGTVVVYRQIKFISIENQSFNIDHVVTISLPTDEDQRSRVNGFRESLRQLPEIKGITFGNGTQAEDLTLSTTFASNNGEKRHLFCNYFFIDTAFIPFFHVELLEGSNISENQVTDKYDAFLVNEAFVKTMGWTDPIGQIVEGLDRKGKVVGVVKNFYYKSMRSLVEPLVMAYADNPWYISLKVQPEVLPKVKTLWKQIFPDRVFEYKFLDDTYAAQYRKDTITMYLFGCFTLLSIFISCLGLYGLVALMTIKRTKEIGIRKVLGASVTSITTMLSKDFVKLVLIAIVIASPIAWWAMNKWLEDFAYRVDIEWWMFALAGVVALVIALLTVSWQAIRAAVANPVDSLRDE